jgi:hypothetical protein
MGKVLDLFFNRRTAADMLYEGATKAMNQLSQKIKIRIEDREEDWLIESNVWQEIVPGDPNSPKIMGLSDNSSLIYYPKFSTPYRHNLTEKCKFATILSGCIHDKVSGKSFSPKRENDGKPYCIKISPTDNFKPYTKGCDCYVLVHVDECSRILEEVCL